MSQTSVPRTNIRGPLFVSRGILATACFVLWILNFYLAFEAGSKRGAAPWHVLVTGLDLLALLVAVQASDAATPRARLANLRATWLVLAIGSGCCAALATVQETGLALIGANALLSGVAVLLVSHLWNLRGFVTLAVATAAVNTALYSVTPGADPRTTSNILFLSLLPGVVGTMSVLMRRDAIQRKGASGLSERLDALTRAIHAKTSARELELAITKTQIDELFAKVAQAPSLPLDPAVAQEAMELAGHLRQLLLAEWSDNWLAEALELEGLGGSVTVAQPSDVVEELPESSRPAILTATMLMAVGATLRGTHRHGTTPRPGAAHRIHFFAEKSGQDGARLTWRIGGVHKNHLSPLLWTELDSLGRAKAHNDREGCSIVVDTAGWRR
ncbi:hypothetical protein [Arthrobacter sp. B2a2-09]|uniref:hypothetical protein n=1 Tax=Arthrobacter sp. B2a2-09 TaxID=2952822 RepID=UPI0022CD5D39|nr:hypothetical protein [Arthrobacter sp. B2a2-09]